jgi:phosphate uptake regulator
MKAKEAKELYLRDKVKELHDVVINMIDEIENGLELSDPTGEEDLTKMGQDIISLLHHIECETCI